MVIFSYKASIIAKVSERFSEVLPINSVNLVSTFNRSILLRHALTYGEWKSMNAEAW